MLVEMKRYLVFEYDYYYPGGGMTDFSRSFDTMEEVNQYLYQQDGYYDITEVWEFNGSVMREVKR